MTQDTVVENETHEDLYAKLTDTERRWVDGAVKALRWDIDDPAALVREDMASPEYALLARRLVLFAYDRPRASSRNGSLGTLRAVAEHRPDACADRAMAVMDRMLSLGLTKDEVLDFVAFVERMAAGHVRERIDAAEDMPAPKGWPGWVLMETVDGAMTGRKISGGERFSYQQHRLDPWPGDPPDGRPWKSERLAGNR